jgi:hypothetical protein
MGETKNWVGLAMGERGSAEVWGSEAAARRSRRRRRSGSAPEKENGEERKEEGVER